MAGSGDQQVGRPMSRWKAAGWRRLPLPADLERLLIMGGADDTWLYQKDLADGHLTVLAGPEREGFHLSISHRTDDLLPGRYPTWDEILEARNFFTPPAMAFVMHLPTKEDYVNLHDTTFHLWEAES